jgi:hypothetical protein
MTIGNQSEFEDYLKKLERKVDRLSEKNLELEDTLGELSRLRTVENVTEDWLQVPFRFVNVSSATTSIITRTVSGDGPFDLVEITYTAISSTGTANNNGRIRIREGEAVGRTLTQDGDFVDLDNTAGTAQRPYIIKGRRRYRANIAIIVELTNTLPGPATNTVEVVLHGIKVFTR